MKTNIKKLVWSCLGCLLLLSACEKQKSDYVLGQLQTIDRGPAYTIPTHLVAENPNYRLGKWAWQVPVGDEWRGTDTIHFRTDSTMSWFIPLGIQKYRFDRNTFHYEWKDFVSPRVVWQYSITRFDTLNEILYVDRGSEVRPYKKVR